MKKEAYDIIGDIHGHASELVQLLNQLGYVLQDGAYQHPEGRRVIFVGDYIDRGPQPFYVCQLVRAMQEAGSAIALMGNHEFNFVCYHEKNLKKGGYVRKHTLKNHNQIAKTLSDFASHSTSSHNTTYDALEDMLNWFRSLPLWLEEVHFRVVHACWDSTIIQKLKSAWKGNVIPATAWPDCGIEGAPFYEDIEIILKGRESIIPDDEYFEDEDGHRRDAFRIKWWEEVIGKTRYEAAVKPYDIERLASKDEPIKEDDINFLPYALTEKPVFVGHYWLDSQSDGLHPRSTNVACLDYSVAKQGQLVAYRYDGSARLDENHFVWFGKG